MSEQLLSTRFLFRFAVPCLHEARLGGREPRELDARHRLLSPGELDGEKSFADVRVAWSEAGVGLSLRIAGKKQTPWCRESRLEDSDSLQVWIDTRDTHNIHRASRFCHRFVFLPGGAGPNHQQPVADQLLVERARENAHPVRPGQLQIATEKLSDGYVLAALIPSAALTGFDPVDHPRLGFTYQVFDRELGAQHFSVGGELPFASDPSLWGTLELVRE